MLFQFNFTVKEMKSMKVLKAKPVSNYF